MKTKQIQSSEAQEDIHIASVVELLQGDIKAGRCALISVRLVLLLHYLKRDELNQ